MLHHRLKRIGTLALVGAILATVLGAAPARAQDPISLDCRLGSTVRSLESTTPATLEFVNGTLAATVVVSWIDFQGHAQTLATLQPGQSYSPQTFLTHPWKVTAANGACLGLYLPQPQPARVVIRPDDLPPFSCAVAASARSREATMPTTIEFFNETTSQVIVVVWWIDYQGQSHPYATLQPGQSYSPQTYLTHPWKVTTTDGMCLGIYMPTQRPGRVVLNPAAG
jgi:VHL beta domain